MGSARGGRRHRNDGGDGRAPNSPRGGGGGVPAAVPTDAHSVLQMVAANPALQGVHVVVPALIQQGLPEWVLPTFAEMLQGNGPTFGVLQGEPPARSVRRAFLFFAAGAATTRASSAA